MNGEAQLVSEMKDFGRDVELFNKNIDSLKKEYPDKFVAFHKGEVVMQGRNIDELIRNAEKKGIDIGIMFVGFVSTKEQVLIL